MVYIETDKGGNSFPRLEAYYEKILGEKLEEEEEEESEEA